MAKFMSKINKLLSTKPTSTSGDYDKLQLIKQRFSASESGKNNCSWAVANVWDYLWRQSPNNNVKAIDDTTKMKGNLPMVFIENQVGVCNDAQIDMIVYPKLPGYDLDSHVYQIGVKWVQELNNDPEIRDRLHKFAFLEGTSIIKAWIEDKPQGRMIRYDAVDPKYIRCDPMATSNDDIRYVIQICHYTKNELKEMFPAYDPKRDDSIEVSVSDEVDVWNQSEANLEDEMERVLDHYDVMSGERTVITERQVLHTEKMKIGLPFVFIPLISAPDRVYGKDLYSELRDLFDQWNMNKKRLADIVAKNAMGDKVISGRYIQPNRVTNEDNQTYVVNTDDVRKAVMWAPPPPFPTALVDLIKLDEYYLRQIAGVEDITTGRAEINAGTPSGVSLDKLQQAAQTRVRNYIDRLRDIGYTRLANIIIRMMHEYFDKEQIVRITGTDVETINQIWSRDEQNIVGEAVKAGAINGQEIKKAVDIYRSEKGISRKNVGDSVYLSFTGKLLGDPTTFAVRGEGGIDTAKKKLDISQQSLMLANMGLIDPQTLLEAIDFPLKEKALQRSPQWNAFLQFQQQQAKQQQMVQQVQDSEIKSQMKEQITQKEASSVKPNQGVLADNPSVGR